MNLNRKTVLVTGGNRGIGRATIIEFAKKGFNVIINYCNNEDDANKLKKLVENDYGVDALIIKSDISIEKEVVLMVEKSISIFGKIDVLVNNAGIAIDKLFEDKNAYDFQKTLNVNLIGTFLVTKYVAENMLQNKKGKIINVASTNGIDTYYPMSLDYDASKAGVISLTHNFAVQYAPYINVNAVAPGWINTDMNKELDEDFVNTECKKIFLNRFGNPSEIAKVICFLASDDASYINNEIIRIDGGY